MTENEFKLVTKKGFGKQKHLKTGAFSVTELARNLPTIHSVLKSDISSKTICEKVERFRSVVRFDKLTERLVELSAGVDNFVSFGIGPLATAVSSQIQLAVFLEIACTRLTSSLHLYEPVLGLNECDAVRQLGISLLECNSECAYPVDRRTLVFMPHCCVFLYANLLLANFGHWDRIFIAGNSFERMTSLSVGGAVLRSLVPLFREIALPLPAGSGGLAEAFSDTVVLMLDAERAQAVLGDAAASEALHSQLREGVARLRDVPLPDFVPATPAS